MNLSVGGVFTGIGNATLSAFLPTLATGLGLSAACYCMKYVFRGSSDISAMSEPLCKCQDGRMESECLEHIDLDTEYDIQCPFHDNVIVDEDLCSVQSEKDETVQIDPETNSNQSNENQEDNVPEPSFPETKCDKPGMRRSFEDCSTQTDLLSDCSFLGKCPLKTLRISSKRKTNESTISTEDKEITNGCQVASDDNDQVQSVASVPDDQEQVDPTNTETINADENDQSDSNGEEIEVGNEIVNGNNQPTENSSETETDVSIGADVDMDMESSDDVMEIEEEEYDVVKKVPPFLEDTSDSVGSCSGRKQFDAEQSIHVSTETVHVEVNSGNDNKDENDNHNISRHKHRKLTLEGTFKCAFHVNDVQDVQLVCKMAAEKCLPELIEQSVIFEHSLCEGHIDTENQCSKRSSNTDHRYNYCFIYFLFYFILFFPYFFLFIV